MTTKAAVLLSGGQDSTTCLYWALDLYKPDELVAVSVHYGQRHVTELAAASEIARGAGVRHVVLPLPALGFIGDSALLNKTLPLDAAGGRPDAQAPDGLPTSFVPGRNLLFLALAAAVACKEGARDIITGVCEADYSGYPDCRREFVDAMERTLNLAMPSSAGPFRVHTPLMHLSKLETVRLAERLPGCLKALARSVTCYHGKRPGCGECPACVLRAKGFALANLTDPATVVA